MRAAFPQVAVPGARLVLAGPGRPGRAAARRRARWAPVDHSRGARPAGRRARGVDPAAAPRQLRSRGADEARGGDGRRAPRGGRATSAGWARSCAPPGAASSCRPDDAAAHAAALDRLLGPGGEAARMGAAGRAAFLDGLGFEAQARALTSLYAEVLGP